MQRKIWTKEEEAKLREIYPFCGIHELMIFFQCSAAQIWKKAGKMRLAKHNEYLSDIRKKNALINIKAAQTATAQEKRSNTIRTIIRRERVRLKYGLKQRTRWRFAPYKDTQKYSQWKFSLRQRGYITQKHSLGVFYDDNTERNLKKEQHLINKGFSFQSINESHNS